MGVLSFRPMRTNPIIVALDLPSLDRSIALARELSPFVGCFKVGLELLTAEGVPRVLERFAAEKLPVFADVKFSDIPNTVAGATEAVTRYPIEFFDVHASCGRKSVEMAAQKKGKAKLLAVTVLTSIESQECETLFGSTPEKKVLELARMAQESGADGVVCSPWELGILSGLELIKVTPGIRPSWAAQQDQKRALSPKEALARGADYLVIGRPITKPGGGLSPRDAVQKILSEIGWSAS